MKLYVERGGRSTTNTPPGPFSFRHPKPTTAHHLGEGEIAFPKHQARGFVLFVAPQGSYSIGKLPLLSPASA